MLLIFYINIVELEIIWLIEKQDLHFFRGGGSAVHN